MKNWKSFLITLFLLLTTALPAATVSTNFTGTTNGGQLFVRYLDSFTYSVSGTFVGTVVLERTESAGMSWEFVLSASSAVSGTIQVETKGGSAATYRFRCSSFTSGTIVTSIADATAEVIYNKNFFNSLGQPVAAVTETGLSVVDLNVTGSFSIPVFTGQIAGVDGSAAAPSFTFGSALSTGWYKDTVLGGMSLSVAGTRRMNVATSYAFLFVPQVFFEDGTVGSPSIAFNNSSGSGFRLISSGRVGLSLNAVQALDISADTMVYGGSSTGTRTMYVENSSATSGAHAALLALTNGASGGDPFLRLTNGVAERGLGIDTSDSNTFKITNFGGVSGGSTHLSITTGGLVTLGASGGTAQHAVNGQTLNLLAAAAGLKVTLGATNTDNTSLTSHAKLNLITGGGASGDPYLYFSESTMENSIGIDNSDSNIFKLTTGDSPSAGTTLLSVTQAGLVTLGTGTSNINRINGATETAAAGTATLLNMPTNATGNPDVFIKINYNGIDYVIPAWTP